MLDGWYCRSIANMQAEDEAAARGAQVNAPQSNEDYSSDSSHSESERINYRDQYVKLKKKLKYLIYENECFQDALRTSQKRLLKACRDRSFLLDRLLQYEKPENTSSETDESESSEDAEIKTEPVKRKKTDSVTGGQPTASNVPSVNRTQNGAKRKRPPAPKKIPQNVTLMAQQIPTSKTLNLTSDGHMTPEEVERHLQSRQSFLELVPERAPPTVPTEMFSNDPSLDSESNDVLEVSSCNIGEESWIE